MIAERTIVRATRDYDRYKKGNLYEVYCGIKDAKGDINSYMIMYTYKSIDVLPARDVERVFVPTEDFDNEDRPCSLPNNERRWA